MTTPEERRKNAEYMRAWYKRHPEKLKEYYAAHKEQLKQRSKDWRDANPDKVKAMHKRYRADPSNRAKENAGHRKWSRSHKAQVNEYQKEYDALYPEKKKRRGEKYHWNVKRRLFEHYATNGVVQCTDPFKLHLPNDPFRIDLRTLSIDHINGGGNKHRKAIGGGGQLYWWLKHNDFPSGFQILCMNCQAVKRVLKGEMIRRPNIA